ncbi:MAG: hypothetical protein ABSF69_21370 [Polyangiaceae bacterium]|jgi:hypothetical protein
MTDLHRHSTSTTAAVGRPSWVWPGLALPQGFPAIAVSTGALPPFSIAVEGCAFSDAAPSAQRNGGVLLRSA